MKNFSTFLTTLDEKSTYINKISTLDDDEIKELYFEYVQDMEGTTGQTYYDMMSVFHDIMIEVHKRKLDVVHIKHK